MRITLLAFLFSFASICFGVGEFSIMNSRGNSMLPAIPSKCQVFIVRKEYSTIQKGEIVVYYNRKCRIVIDHRTVCKSLFDKSAWVMKGDNNNFYDSGFMLPEDYMGTVILFRLDEKSEWQIPNNPTK